MKRGYAERARQAVRQRLPGDKSDISDKRYLNGCTPQAEGGLMSLKSLMSHPQLNAGDREKVCAQCGAGPGTDPPSDVPTVKLGRVWVHPECKRFFLAGTEVV
jgi:hypothetical protein